VSARVVDPVDVSIPTLRDTRQAREEPVRNERKVGDRAGIEPVVCAVGQRGRAAAAAGGLFGENLDGPRSTSTRSMSSRSSNEPVSVE
jgi:hypothetical protein